MSRYDTFRSNVGENVIQPIGMCSLVIIIPIAICILGVSLYLMWNFVFVLFGGLSVLLFIYHADKMRGGYRGGFIDFMILIVVTPVCFIVGIDGLIFLGRVSMNDVWVGLLFMDIGDYSFFYTLYIVVCLDILVHLLCIGVNQCITLLLWRSERRMRYNTMFNLSVLIYRSMVPFRIWIGCICNHGSMYMVMVLFPYVLHKLVNFAILIKHVETILDDIFNDINPLCPVDKESLDGNLVCSICLEKPTSPTALVCKHVFCIKCLTDWLSQADTCPNCRKRVGMVWNAQPDIAYILPFIMYK